MSHGHNDNDGHRVPPAGAHRPVYAAPEIPRFKHASRDPLPRYWPVLGAVWLFLLGFVIRDCFVAIKGADIDTWDYWHLREALWLIGFMWAISLLWKSWRREELDPYLLPHDEFARRYPPSTGSNPR